MNGYFANAFDVFTDYALDNRPALLEAVLSGDALPALEQPCWECGRLRYFWDTREFGFIEQCATERVSSGVRPRGLPAASETIFRDWVRK